MTGFKDIDRVIDGLEKGKLYIIAARPSMGKTMLCLNIARNLALGGAKVGFFSLEQHRKALLERLVFAECRINRFALRGADSDRDKFWDAWAVVEKLPIYVNDATRILTDTVMTEVMSLRISQGIDILFFDYISLAGDKDEHSEVRRIGNIVKNLQRIARLAEIPVIAVSQLSRAPEHRQERRPGLSDLRDSGEIEQDADVVIGLYRDEFYHANTEEPHNLECIILKNRDGARGTVKLYYDATTGFMGDKVKS
jgi:replicative DNA helicase